MRKWELITDLFSYYKGAMFPEHADLEDRKFIEFYICGCACKIYPKDWPKHFRLVEQPEFTESDMIEAILKGSKTDRDYNKRIIETIRKRNAGK